MTQRPTSVMVFSILNVLFGITGVFGTLMSLPLLFQTGSNNPITKIMQDNPGYLTFMKISVPLGIAVSIFLIVAGIGLYRLKNWARKLSIGYGIYAIISGPILMVANYILVINRSC